MLACRRDPRRIACEPNWGSSTVQSAVPAWDLGHAIFVKCALEHRGQEHCAVLYPDLRAGRVNNATVDQTWSPPRNGHVMRNVFRANGYCAVFAPINVIYIIYILRSAVATLVSSGQYILQGVKIRTRLSGLKLSRRDLFTIKASDCGVFTHAESHLAGDDNELKVRKEDDDEVGEGLGEGSLLRLHSRQDDRRKDDQHRRSRNVQRNAGQAPCPLHGAGGIFFQDM